MSLPPCPLLNRRLLLLLGPALAAAAPGAMAEAPPAETRWRCAADQCPGYVYDPAKGERAQGVAPGTAWEAVREDFFCPRCGAGKSEFRPLD